MQPAQLLKMHGSKMIQDVLMLMGKLTKTQNSVFPLLSFYDSLFPLFFPFLFFLIFLPISASFLFA